MNSKKTKHSPPVIGGNILELGKFVYRMIVVLSDHLDPKDQELVAFEYKDKALAVKRREVILMEGINVIQTDEGVDIDIFYPARSVRKIIIRAEPAAIQKRSSALN